MSFATLIGNERNKSVLKSLVTRSRFGATYLFTGPEGIGKRQFALTFAKTANCTERRGDDSCDKCPSCHRIDEGTHSDVVTVRPDGAFIKIGQAREVAREIYFRPREGAQRFFLIDDAERLREEAESALLKTLEEPPPTSTIILITPHPSSLMPTVLSRSQRVAFSPLNRAEMEKFLKETYKRPAKDTELLARITEGRVGQANAIDLEQYRKDRRELIELVELLAARDTPDAQSKRVRLLKASEHYSKLDRSTFEKRIEMLTQVLRDVIILSSGGSDEQIANIDEHERLSKLSKLAPREALIQWSEKFTELRMNLLVNVNLRVALDGVLQSS